MNPEQFRTFASVLPEAMLMVTLQGEILAANPAAASLLNIPAEALIGTQLDAIADSPSEKVRQYLRSCAGQKQLLPGALTLAGLNLRCEGALMTLSPGTLLLRLKSKEVSINQFVTLNQRIDQLTREILERKRMETLLSGQVQTLEQIAGDVPLSEVLKTLLLSMEAHSSAGMLGSVMLYDPDTHCLIHGAAPSLPESYNQAVDGLAIGPASGSCGAAAHLKQTVIATDISSDPHWPAYRSLAEQNGLRACWSIPILSTDNRLLGTFAMYYRQSREPTPQDLLISRLVTRTASIAIERKQSHEALARLLESERESRNEAEQANRIKDEFLATVSHELRTPLNAMLGWAEMLCYENPDAATLKRGLDIMLHSARAQHQIIGDLLDVSRIISGKLRLEIQPFDPIHVIEAALDVVRPAADAKSISLALKIDPSAGSLTGDADRILQVLWNLLSNAIKFTPNGGHVSVWLQRQASHLEFGIQDDGIGMTAEFLPHIFERFRQADGSSRRHYGGLGLGLAIVRHLVELHGGTVDASSAGEGQGAVFTVLLPKNPALAEDPS